MKCFIKEMELRPTAEQLLEHHIFAMEQSSRPSKKPSYKELKSTLRTLRGRPKKKPLNISVSLEWNPVPSPVTTPDSNVLRTSLSSSMTRSVAQESVAKALQDELHHETELRKEKEATIQRLLEENDRLSKAVRDITKQKVNPEEFYKDYFITIAMSIKVINHNRGKELKIDMKELLDKAKQKKVAIHELIEWIPRQIKKQSSMSKTHLY